MAGLLVFSRRTMEKRRGLRRFFVAALLATSPALAQQPMPAVQPVVDMVLADEAELAAAIRALDAARLQRLAWANHQAAFNLVKSDPPIVPGDGAATALRAAWVACANTHSTIGMLASGAVQILITNSGGDNTSVDNDANRNSFDFFLRPYGERRSQCGARSGLTLPPTPLAAAAAQLIPAFQQIRTKGLSADDRAEMVRFFKGLAGFEQNLPGFVAGNDPEPIRTASIAVMDFMRFLHVRDDPDMPRRDFLVFKECRWAGGHMGQILSEVHEALVRPEIRPKQLASARDTLDQYRRTKADCARALGLPREEGEVRGLTDTDLQK